MLGVFGSVPAFDTYFKKRFRASTLGRRAVREVGFYYRDIRIHRPTASVDE